MRSRLSKKLPADAEALSLLESLIGDDLDLAEMLAEERTNAAVARQIFALRTAQGLTQRQLADAIGTRQPVIARLEDADYEGHSLSMLHRVGAALGCTVAVLLVPRSRAARTSSGHPRGSRRRGRAHTGNRR